MKYSYNSKVENLANAHSEEGSKMRGIIPAGTLCNCQGIPFVLLQDVEVYTHPLNIQVMDDLANNRFPQFGEQKQ